MFGRPSVRRRPLRVELLEQRTVMSGYSSFVLDPGDNIQDVIDNQADPGDVILLKPGTYEQTIVIDKDLTLRGLSFKANKVVIDPINVDGASAIRVTSDADRVTIKNLRVTDSGEDGIEAYGLSKLVVENVIADGHDDKGIEISDAERVVVKCVTATDNLQNGLSVVGGPATVDVFYSKFTGNGFDPEGGLGREGITLEEVGNVRIKGVTARANNEWGLEVRSAGNVDICYSRFTDNLGGTRLDNVGDVWIKGVTASRNLHTGLSVSNAGNVDIFCSEFSENDERGDYGSISIYDVHDVLIKGVTARENGGSGLRVARADNVKILCSRFTDNGQFSENGGEQYPYGSYSHGVDLSDVHDVWMKGVTGRGNGGSGLRIAGADTVKIFCSRFTDNGEDGLNVDEAGQVRLVFSAFSGNGDDGVQYANLTGGQPETCFVVAKNNGNLDFNPPLL